MRDSIDVAGLRVPCRIGWEPAEREEPQTVVVDLSLTVDLKASGASDDLSDTIDYGRVTGDVARLAASKGFKLLEHLAAAIADEMLQLSGVHGVTVDVGKLDVPVPEEVASVRVHIERDKP